MTDKPAKTCFRAKPSRILAATIVPISLCAFAILALRLDDTGMWTIASLGSLFTLTLLVETLMEFVALEPDRLVFCKLFKTTEVPKAEIAEAVLTSRGGASVQTTQGRWLMVPDFGHGSDRVTEAIQQWLNR